MAVERALYEALRRKDANLPHLLDVAVQILRDEGLFDVFEEVLSEDLEAMRSEENLDALNE